MSPRMRRRLTFGTIALIALAIGGCASLSSRAQDSSLKALATAEPKPSSLPKSSDCEDTRSTFQSEKPMVLPRPGAMPAGSTMREIVDTGYLRVGVDQSSLRLGYLNPTTTRPQMEGFDVDIVREIARALFGIRSTDSRVVDGYIRYTAVSTKQRQTAISSGLVDIVASAYSINCDRLRYMRFSSVYHRADQRLLVLKDSPFSKLTAPTARGKRICATANSTTIDYLQDIDAKTGIVPVEVDQRPDCLVRLQEGRVNAVSSDDAILYGFQQQDPQTRIVGPSLQCEQWGLAINRQHRDLVRFVNGVLVQLRRGRLREIRDFWLGDLLREPATGPRSCAARFG